MPLRISDNGALRAAGLEDHELRDLFNDDATIDPQAVEVASTRSPAWRWTAARSSRAICSSRSQASRPMARASSMPAIASGAVAVAGDHPPAGVAACRSSPRPIRAARWRWRRRNFIRGSPSTIAAVTGTSGKTSVAAFTRQIWQRLGHASASIGTIGLVSPKRTIYGSLTTPDPIALHRQLDEIAREGVTHLALRGFIARARSVSAGRRADRRRRFHQPVARPHGLPSRRRALSCRQAQAVPRSRRRRWRGGDLGRS